MADITAHKTLHSGEVFRRYWNHTKKYPLYFVVGLIGAVMAQASYIAAPLFLGEAINLITTLPTETGSLPPVYWQIGFFTFFSFLGWVGARLEMWGGMIVIIRASTNLVDESFSHLIRHSHHFFTSSFAGSLTRKVGRYMSAYERLYYSIQTSVLPSVLYIAGITVVLFFKSFLLGLILLVAVVVFTSMQWLMARMQRPLRYDRAQTDTAVTGAIADSISNQNTVLLFAEHMHERSLVLKGMKVMEKAWYRLWYSDLIVYGIFGLFSVVINVSLLSVAAYYWSTGILNVGDFVIIQAYAFGLFNSVWSIGRDFKHIYSAVADASEMVEILQKEHEIKDKVGAKELSVRSGVISFSGVTFGFLDSKNVLKNLDIRISAGEKVALVGLSGAGKTTVTKLLLRLYDITEGAILIDGQNIADVTQESLRRAIAFVPQEPILFHRTLQENIRYGRQGATDEEVIEAAKKAHCHEFISKLPLGYDTFVGERGVKLSGGERQRVAIARALLKNAPILVLDEATSSLDSESEHLIQDAFETLMRGKTVIVIAHRLSTIMKMDKILVMEAGKVVAHGTHASLLETEGLYKKLWSIQAGGFLIDADDIEEAQKELPEEIMEEHDEELAEDVAHK